MTLPMVNTNNFQVPTCIRLHIHLALSLVEAFIAELRLFMCLDWQKVQTGALSSARNLYWSSSWAFIRQCTKLACRVQG